MADKPGINCIAYAATSHHAYYTSTAQDLLILVAVDPETSEPWPHPWLRVTADAASRSYLYDDHIT
jgi:hypothetical protein